MTVIVEDKAKDKIKSKKADSVYCYLHMCAS